MSAHRCHGIYVVPSTLGTLVAGVECAHADSCVAAMRASITDERFVPDAPLVDTCVTILGEVLGGSML